MYLKYEYINNVHVYKCTDIFSWNINVINKGNKTFQIDL